MEQLEASQHGHRERVRELVRSYRSSAEFAAAVASVGDGRVRFGGLWGSSLAFFLAAWEAQAAPAAPCLIVTATLEEADELGESIELFSGSRVLPFPAWESLFSGDSEPDADILGARLDVLARLGEADPWSGYLVAPVQALLQPVPPPEVLRRAVLELRCDSEMPPERVVERLVACGFRGVPLVERRGEFSRRGDVLDFFPYQEEHPLRLEFFGDTLESVREFRTESQRSLPDSERAAARCYLPARGEVFRDCLRDATDTVILDYLPATSHVIVVEPDSVASRTETILHNVLADDSARVHADFRSRLERRPGVDLQELTAGESVACTVEFRSVERYRGDDLKRVCEALGALLARGDRLLVFCQNDAERVRFLEILSDNDLTGLENLSTVVGSLLHGFESVALETVCLTTRDLFNRTTLRRTRRRTAPGRAIQSFLELSKGDYVVHLAHGVGRYLGMEALEKDGAFREFLVVEYRGGLKVYVPVAKTDLVQKYVGPGAKPPRLDKVGGSSWSRKKDQVKAALVDLASDLLEVQALRQERPGIAYPPESEWQREFEAAFPFEDTPDQFEVTEAIKRDMENSRPMDRLICGDVGYGKTELSMRAAFKAVEAGRQVAMLVPTTVLAQQHFRTFRERMASFPITIDVLSRFRTPRQQKETLAAAAEGRLDILIGTHRLLSNDVRFCDLGLVIIDEEQRFGVAHKEKLKRLRTTVDILTLTATPIPRTLHMSLLGIKDISSLTTAPEGRNPVVTRIGRFDPEQFRDIVIRELNRDGQLYFVHNRIQDIDQVKSRLEQIVPEARTEYAHGRMNEHELEEIMYRFVEGKIDLLISTTIIESGIDIPNVNTIVIDDADCYGLADLHQLRGRVGRYRHQAYCYLILPEHREVNGDARKRLQALVEFSELGAGFQIAMRDLEIRGAGNILGAAQSGHIALVGYDMYCRLLESTVRKLKHEEQADPIQVEIDLALEAYIPEEFVPQEARRLELYRRLSQIQTAESLDDFHGEVRDRFGELPAPFDMLGKTQRLRVHCAAFGIDYIGREEGYLMLRGREAMRTLLADCPARVVVLDGRSVAVSLQEARTDDQPIDDELAFEVACEWLATSRYPVASRRARRRFSAV